MFGKNAEVSSGDRHGHSIFQQGIMVRGEVEAKGDVRFDGRLEGKITVSERLTVGASGILSADVEASEVVVMGRIEGKVRARRRLELLKGARVTGDVTTPVLVVEEGVVFHGNSNMKPEEGETEVGSIESTADAEEATATYKTAYR